MLVSPRAAAAGPHTQPLYDEAFVVRLQMDEVNQALQMLLAQRAAGNGRATAGAGSSRVVDLTEEDPVEVSLRQQLEELAAIEARLKRGRQGQQQQRVQRAAECKPGTAGQQRQFHDLTQTDEDDDDIVEVVVARYPRPGSSSAQPIDLVSPAAGPSSSTAHHATSPPDPPPRKKPRLSAAPSRARVPSPRLPCSICFDDFEAEELVQAGETSGPSTSYALPGCGHLFCRACMRQYVQSKLAGRTYPLICPQPQCSLALDYDTVVTLLGNSAQDLQALRDAEIASAIPPYERLYCPHKDCSALVLRAEDVGQDSAATCPQCTRSFCPTCLIPGWHKGFSCAEFQELPAHQRSAEDALLLAAAAKNRWQPCPTCKMLVGRTQGCDHIQCRCGTHFCYKCGKKYRSRGITACKCFH